MSFNTETSRILKRAGKSLDSRQFKTSIINRKAPDIQGPFANRLGKPSYGATDGAVEGLSYSRKSPVESLRTSRFF